MIEAERLAFREEILDTWNITQCLMSHLVRVSSNKIRRTIRTKS